MIGIATHTLTSVSTSLFLKVHPITILPPPGNRETAILDLISIKASDSQLIKDNIQQGCDNPPAYNIVEEPKNTSSRVEAAVGHLHGDPPATVELQPFDPRTLPPATASSSNTATELIDHDDAYDVDDNAYDADDDDDDDIDYDADRSESTTKLGSLSHHKYNTPKSISSDTSSSGAVTSTSAAGTTKSSLLSVSHHSPIIAPAPFTDQPTPEASQAPSTTYTKFGKANLNYLNDKLQHKKEVAQTVVQTGGAGVHSHSSSDCVNIKMRAQMLQGGSDITNKSTFGKPDLRSLRDKLEKTKKEREKNVVAGGVNKTPDHHNLSEVFSYISENRMMMKNLPDKKPMASCRIKAPTTNSSHSASSTASSKAHYKLWQCAYCQTVNETHHNSCMHCKLPCGQQADRSALCEFCQLMIFIPARGKATDVCCPRCKEVFETVL